MEKQITLIEYFNVDMQICRHADVSLRGVVRIIVCTETLINNDSSAVRGNALLAQ
jgi:hypothetical protein